MRYTSLLMALLTLLIKEINHMNINKIAAYFAFVGYVVAATYTPVWVAIWTIAFLIALPVLSDIVNGLFPLEEIYVTPAPKMSDYYEAFSVEPEVVDELAQVEQPSDVWGDVHANACELACTVSIIAPMQLLLAPAYIEETVNVINYTTLSYREVQALVKQARTSNDVKLNAKKDVLVAWLMANV